MPWPSKLFKQMSSRIITATIGAIRNLTSQFNRKSEEIIFLDEINLEFLRNLICMHYSIWHIEIRLFSIACILLGFDCLIDEVLYDDDDKTSFYSECNKL
ncbi:unnamed protein product [Rotaria magnacalcarata]